MNVAIVLAGGKGTRVGADTPKQYIEVLGKPVIAYTLENFQSYRNIDAIAVVVSDSYREYVEKLVSASHLDKVRWFVRAGNDFQHSVMNAVHALEPYLSADDITVFQFAVSPLTDESTVDKAIEVCSQHGNAVAATPMILSLAQECAETEGCTDIPLCREKIFGFSSPWCFKFAVIRQCYEQAIADGSINRIEPHTTSLLFAQGHKIFLAETNSLNFKITFKEDLELFEGYLLQQRRKNSQEESQLKNNPAT